MVSANLPSRRPVPVEDEVDDALNREMRQRPLAPQKSEKLMGDSKKRKTTHQLGDEFEFNDGDKVILP